MGSRNGNPLATYLPDELAGGAGIRLKGPTHGVHIGTHTIWGSADRPLSFWVANENEEEIHFLVDVEFLDGEKVVGHSLDILADGAAGKRLLRLASYFILPVIISLRLRDYLSHDR